MKKKQTLPPSWYTPAVTLDEHGNVNTSWLDNDMAERYKAGQGILVPVASTDGRILSEKRQKAILKHYLTGKSHERFDLMVGVLRRDPEETVTQIMRWCELFQRLTGKRRTRDALRRIGVRAFAVCSPRNVTSPVLQRKTFVEALDLGLPTVIYQVPHLSGAAVDPELIRELVHKYDNVLLVLTDEEAGAPKAVETVETVDEATEELSVTKAIAEEAAIETVDEATEELEPASGRAADEATEELVIDEVTEEPVSDEVTEEPVSDEVTEESVTDEVTEELAVDEATASLDKTTEAPKTPATPEEPAKRERTPEEKRKRLRRMVAAELAAAVLMGFVLYSTVLMRAAEQRSDVLAAASAAQFMTNASPVVGEGKAVVHQEAVDAVIQARIERLRDTARRLEYIEEERDYDIEESETYKLVQGSYEWNGPVINRSIGTVTGPNGRETYYNLNMGGVVSIMRRMGNTDTYWIRSDGCKMLGNYIMVAADLNVHPRGSIVRSSRGLAIVCDTGTFARSNPQQLDIAVAW